MLRKKSGPRIPRGGKNVRCLGILTFFKQESYMIEEAGFFVFSAMCNCRLRKFQEKLIACHGELR